MHCNVHFVAKIISKTKKSKCGVLIANNFTYDVERFTKTFVLKFLLNWVVKKGSEKNKIQLYSLSRKVHRAECGCSSIGAGAP